MIREMEILLDQKLSMISWDQIKKDIILEINLALQNGEKIEGINGFVEKKSAGGSSVNVDLLR